MLHCFWGHKARNGLDAAAFGNPCVGAMSTVEEGAEAVVRLAVSPELEGVTGRYFDGKRKARANRQAYDVEAGRRLWTLSEELCGCMLDPVVRRL